MMAIAATVCQQTSFRLRETISVLIPMSGLTDLVVSSLIPTGLVMVVIL
jgi:hypothetical protein